MFAAMILAALSLVPVEKASEALFIATAECPLGCVLVDDGKAPAVIYEVTKDDVLWLTKAIKCESGPRFVPAESSATAWALVQGWYEVNRRRGSKSARLTIGEFVQNYSACNSRKWATGGTHYSPRITPRADLYRAMKWSEIPIRWRKFSSAFLHGDYPNAMPGAYHVLARGFEEFASEELIGPMYATTEEQHPGGNAYYQTPATKGWAPDLFRIIPPSLPVLIAMDGEDGFLGGIFSD